MFSHVNTRDELGRVLVANAQSTIKDRAKDELELMKKTYRNSKDRNRRFPEITGEDNLIVFSYSG